jgi:hypothetical protein
MMSSSRGDAIGRAPSRKRWENRSFHEVTPQCSADGSCSNCSKPISHYAVSLIHPEGESLSTCRETELIRYLHPAGRFALSAAFIIGTR